MGLTWMQCSSSSGYKDPIIGYLGFGEQYCSTGFGYVDDYRELGSLGSLLVLVQPWDYDSY